MFTSVAKAEENAVLDSESLATKTARGTAGGESGTHSVVPNKYVPFQELIHPKFKNLKRVERNPIELGTPTVTEHFSKIPPEQVRTLGGIFPPNPNNKDETLVFGNKMYEGGPESPYVISYKNNPGQRMEPGSNRYKYAIVSQPSDISLEKLGFVPPDYGANRQVLRLGKVPLTDIMAVYDYESPIAKVYTFPEFENNNRVTIPTEIQTYGTSLPVLPIRF
jgi:hypothetical protein